MSWDGFSGYLRDYAIQGPDVGDVGVGWSCRWCWWGLFSTEWLMGLGMMCTLSPGTHKYMCVHKIVLYEMSWHQMHVKFVHFATTRARGYIYKDTVGRERGCVGTSTGACW